MVDLVHLVQNLLKHRPLTKFCLQITCIQSAVRFPSIGPLLMSITVAQDKLSTALADGVMVSPRNCQCQELGGAGAFKEHRLLWTDAGETHDLPKNGPHLSVSNVLWRPHFFDLKKYIL